MDHISDVRLVDAHAEGDGGHDHVDLLAQEGVLIGRTGRTVHAGMIGQCLHSVEFQHLGEFLDLAAAQAVDDTRLPLVGLGVAHEVDLDVLGLGPDLVI